VTEVSLRQPGKTLSFPGAVLSLPNLLTGLRVILLPFILMTLLRGKTALAATLVCGAFATDALDGWSARRFNQISKGGKVLDPLIDKIAVGSILTLLVPLRGFPFWIAALIVLRDLTILGIGGVLIRRKGIILSSNPLGKATGLLFFSTIMAYVVSLQPVGYYLALTSVGFVLASSTSYLMRLFRIVSQREKGHDPASLWKRRDLDRKGGRQSTEFMRERDSGDRRNSPVSFGRTA